VQIAEFDRFADAYDEQHRANITITGEVPEYFAEYKIRVVSELAHGLGAVARILDFGSGIGGSIPHFRRYMPQARLTCADVSQRSLDLAEARFPDLVNGMLIEHERIPATDASFDMAFSACVFHHIPHREHVHWLRELRRVTRPGGMIVVFEHNPLNPLTVRAVRTCPFDVDARLIRARELAARCHDAGWAHPTVRYHLFFPRTLSLLRPLEHRLRQFPLGAQYSVVAVAPAAG